MPTKQELKEFINSIRKTLPLLVAGTQVEYALGVNTAFKLIEDEFGLNDIGVNVEG